MRPEGWEFRLVAEIEAARGRPWQWGHHDCASFAGRCARAMLQGPCVWEARLGRWSSAKDARRVLAQGGGLLAIMDAEEARIGPRFAMRGDVAAVEGADGPALGVVEGGAIWVAADPGLIRLPLDRALACWPVMAVV